MLFNKLLSPQIFLFAALALTFCLESTSVVALDLVCPRNGVTDARSRIFVDDPTGQDFTEISGSALSSTQKAPTGQPILFVVNDKGGGNRLGVYDSGDGQRLLTLGLDVVPSTNDWESMAIGSCGTFEGTCIYIADIGDNSARKADGDYSERGNEPYRIYKIREPVLGNFRDNDEIPLEHTDILEYDYLHPYSPTDFSDCEAVFLDHTGWGGGTIGDLYLVTKWGRREARTNTRLYRIPAYAWASPAVYSPTPVGYYDGSGDIMRTWTRADMTLDGKLIALGNVDKTYLFPRCPGTSVADALTNGALSCHEWENPRSSDANQYEAFAWTGDGTRNLQIAECKKCKNGRNPPLAWTTMDYNENPAMIVTCPDFQETNPPTIRPTPSPTMQPTPSPTERPTPIPTVFFRLTETPTSGSTPNLTRQPTPLPTAYRNSTTHGQGTPITRL